MYPKKTRTAKYRTKDSISKLPFVGPKYKKKLTSLGIFTLKDLLHHFPARYTDTREIDSISDILQKGEGTILATIESIKNTRTRSRKWITTAKLTDHSGSIKATWFNQPYLTKSIRTGETYLMHGKISTKWGTSLSNPQYECSENSISGDDTTHLGKLTPIYPETYGVSSKWLRARIKPLRRFIPELIDDFIPGNILKKEKLIGLADAIEKIHFPTDIQDIKLAQTRLGINELIDIQMKAQKLLWQRKTLTASQIYIDKDKSQVNKLINSLEFKLTKCQEKSIDEILKDLARNTPMHRLLNGDVGSGKTIVALVAAVAAYDNGYSTIIMAPTTILAQQHYQTINDFLRHSKLNIPVKIVTSSHKDKIHEDPQIIIGTHALIYKQKLPCNTALIVIDEQHRFGVKQRRELENFTGPANNTNHKKDIHNQKSFLQLNTPAVTNISTQKTSPHYLTMTATPIPRTLTMVLYGHTNVSVLDEMPTGRKPIQTHLVPDRKRKNAYNWIKDKIIDGDQAFFIYPLVDESEKVEAKAAKEEYTRLQTDIFSKYKIGLVHGQLKEDEKNEVLQKFKDHKYDILVATPVVEVGIDIPNATIMIIENAERFGLAQLHQFRGRIGRGDKQSYCFLFTASRSEDALDRLNFFSTNTSGFKVAEYDLQRRGPGEVYGLRQSGILKLRFADLSNINKIKKARRIAEAITKLETIAK